MSNHTPGPWEITGPNVRESKSRGLLFVQSCPFADAEPDADEQDANRKLVAASPDLLRVAKALLQRGPVGIESECHWCGREGEDTEHCSSDDCMGTLARAAIAKAEGRA